MLEHSEAGDHACFSEFPLCLEPLLDNLREYCSNYKRKDGAEDILDFRPISLIHSIAKYIAKMMASRLSPHMGSLVSNAQKLPSSRR
jgi:capsule polysaccharide modification protein KpsS